MKFALLLLSLFSVSATVNAQCIDISGTYKVNDTSAVRFRQTACNILRIRYGTINSTGQIDWHNPELQVFLDGRTSCQLGTCWKGSADSNQIKLSRDDDGLTYSEEHGACSYKLESYSVNGKRSVSRTQSVFDCEDGYSGNLAATLTAVN